MEKEDVVQLYHKVFNNDRGLVLSADSYVLEQRVYNGSTYMDLTNVALSNVQASVKGLSKINWAARGNAGFEWNNKTGWTETLYGGTTSITNAANEVHDGNYAYKVVKHTDDTSNTILIPSNDVVVRKGDYMILAFWIKSNASFTNGARIIVHNQTAGGAVKLDTYVTPTTTWQHFENIKVFNTASTWTARIEFVFNKPTASNKELLFDSAVS